MTKLAGSSIGCTSIAPVLFQVTQNCCCVDKLLKTLFIVLEKQTKNIETEHNNITLVSETRIGNLMCDVFAVSVTMSGKHGTEAADVSEPRCASA